MTATELVGLTWVRAWFVSAAVVAGAAYLTSALAAVWNRWRYNRRHAPMQRVTALLAPGGSPADAAEAERLLQELPRRQLEQVLAEDVFPPAVEAALARTLIGRSSTGAVMREAQLPGARRRWRRIAALRVLTLATPAEAFPLLTDALRDGDADVVGAAVVLLGRIGDLGAARVLVDAMRDGVYPASRIATHLDACTADVSAAVAPLLEAETPALRYWGAVLWRRYGRDGAGVARLRALTADADGLVRKGALATLTLIAPDVGRAAALGRLDDDVAFVRNYAARALGAAGHPDDVPALARLLADRDWWVRFAAKTSLERFDARTLESALVPLLTSGDRFARNGAAEVLQHAGVFDRLLQQALGPAGTAASREVLLQLMAAGEARLSDAELAGLSGDLRRRAAALLQVPAPQSAGGTA